MLLFLAKCQKSTNYNVLQWQLISYIMFSNILFWSWGKQCPERFGHLPTRTPASQRPGFTVIRSRLRFCFQIRPSFYKQGTHLTHSTTLQALYALSPYLFFVLLTYLHFHNNNATILGNSFQNNILVTIRDGSFKILIDSCWSFCTEYRNYFGLSFHKIA